MSYIVQVADRNKVTITKNNAEEICEKIRSSMPEVFITKVEAVQDNKFLHAAYQLRKAQHVRTRGYCPTEELYHATSQENVKSILKDNLDWRRVKRSRFGVGVSFSNTPSYANKFCNDRNGAQRAFIVCEVLTANEMRVNCNYSPYPMKNIDTYRSKSNMVIVKFEDNTFYPKCVVYYQTYSNGLYRSLPTYVGFYSDFDSDDSDYEYEDYAVRITHALDNLSLRLFNLNF